MTNDARRLWAVLAAATLGRVAFAYQLQTVASLTSTLLSQFGLAYATVGSLIGAYLLPGAFAALPLGLLGRRFGEERVLIAGLALMTLGNCIPAIAPDPALLAIGRVVAGTGAVALSVMLGKVLADLFTGSRFVAAMGLAVGGFPWASGCARWSARSCCAPRAGRRCTSPARRWPPSRWLWCSPAARPPAPPPRQAPSAGRPAGNAA